MKFFTVFFTLVLALTIRTTADAQESNILIGAGLFGETGDQARNVFPGLALRLSYGLDLPLNEQWSLMPGAGIQTRRGKIHHLRWDGYDPDGMATVDAFCQLRCRFDREGSRMVLGLGPQVSYMLVPDIYYFDTCDPRNGREKFGKWDIGLQPSLIFQTGKRFQWGFEANVGLRNMLRQYPECGVRGRVHLHSLMLVCGWRF